MQSSSPLRRLTTADEMLQFEKIEAVAFCDTFDAASYQFKPSQSPAEIWGYGQPITSAFVVHPFDVSYDGHLVRATGIGGVASLPEGRGKGGIRELFAALLPAWRERGDVFSILYPFSHRFYRQFGYELVQTMHRYTIPIHALSGFSCTEPAEMITEPDTILMLHQAFTAQSNLYIVRKPSQWQMLRRDPYKTRTYTYRLGGRGYVTFRCVDPAPGRDLYTARVLDLAYVDPAGLRAILGFLYGLRAQYETVSLELPASVPLLALFPESYDIELMVVPKGMARVVNVQRALELMRYPQQPGGFCLQVEDSFLPANSGRYQVVYEKGAASSVTPLPADQSGSPDLIVSVQTLTQLTLGALSYDQALWKPDVTLLREPDQIRSVFMAKDIYFTDSF